MTLKINGKKITLHSLYSIQYYMYKEQIIITGVCLWAEDPDPFFTGSGWPKKTGFGSATLVYVTGTLIYEDLIAFL